MKPPLTARGTLVAASWALILSIWAAPSAGQPVPATQPASGGSAGSGAAALPVPATQPEGTTTIASDWFDRFRNPVTWLKWGGDLRLREIYYNNVQALNKDDVRHERHYERIRARLWSTLTPAPDVEINSRLTWEFRSYQKPNDMREVDLDEVLFDNLNVRWRNVLGRPLELTVGRQDIKLGDGWLVIDGTPLDGSRTTFFDAARASYEFKSIKTTADLIYIHQRADSDWLIEPFNHREYPLGNQDEQGAILYVTNKSLARTQVDGYFIYKHDERASGARSTNPVLKPLAQGTDADLYMFGARAVHSFDDHWKARGELAYQFGNKNRRDLSALGFNGQVSYAAKDTWDNQLRLAYEYLSGDDPDTDTNEQFDPLWGRWTHWSDGFPTAMGLEHRSLETTNLHRIGPGWSFKPTAKTEYHLDYHLLFADENTLAGRKGFSRDGHFRGQVVRGCLRHTFNEYLSGHLLTEFFFPGDYYDDFRNDAAVILQAELLFRW